MNNPAKKQKEVLLPPALDVANAKVMRKRCPVCEQVKAATEEFWKFQYNQPGFMCRDCMGSADFRAEEDQTKKAIRTAVEFLVRQAQAGELTVPQTTEICSLMFELRGGIAIVCKQWWEAVDAAREKNAGSKTVLDFYYQLFKMSATTGQEQQKQVADLSDGELEEEMSRIVFQNMMRLYNGEDDGDGDVTKSA